MIDFDFITKFYNDDPDVWATILGPERHYHHGFFFGDETLEAACQTSTRLLYPVIRRGSRVLDIGSGWGGPGHQIARELGASIVGITSSPKQKEVCNFDVEIGNFDKEFPSGRFDVAISVESFDHSNDIPGMFRRLSKVTDTVAFTVNVSDNMPGLYFNDTCYLHTWQFYVDAMLSSGFRPVSIYQWRQFSYPSSRKWIEGLKRAKIGLDETRFNACALADWSTVCTQDNTKQPADCGDLYTCLARR